MSNQIFWSALNRQSLANKLLTSGTKTLTLARWPFTPTYASKHAQNKNSANQIKHSCILGERRRYASTLTENTISMVLKKKKNSSSHIHLFLLNYSAIPFMSMFLFQCLILINIFPCMSNPFTSSTKQLGKANKQASKTKTKQKKGKANEKNKKQSQAGPNWNHDKNQKPLLKVNLSWMSFLPSTALLIRSSRMPATTACELSSTSPPSPSGLSAVVGFFSPGGSKHEEYNKII